MLAPTIRPVTIADLLNLEPQGDDRWHGHSPVPTGRSDLFGGQVAAQALSAASRTVASGHLANSVHCYFMRRGDPAVPLEISVDRVRDGRTYSSRRIEVCQNGKPIFEMLASFHVDEPGDEYDHAMPQSVPDPDELAPRSLTPGADHGLDVRIVPVEAPLVRWWGRVPTTFPDDPAMHLCALLYASDLRAGSAAIMAIGHDDSTPMELRPKDGPIVNFGSLDHALWFHRVPRVDEWFFVEVKPMTVRDSRGLVLGTIFDRQGVHLATFTQEMFLKVAL